MKYEIMGLMPYIEKELNDANQEEWKFFEKGYKLALKNKK